MEIEKRDRTKREDLARARSKSMRPAKKKPSKKRKPLVFEASLEDFQYGPLFRFSEKKAELACLPRLIEDMTIRVMSTLKGEGLASYRCISEYDHEQGERSVENRDKDEQGAEVRAERGRALSTIIHAHGVVFLRHCMLHSLSPLSHFLTPLPFCRQP
jgi:hypothetical protein